MGCAQSTARQTIPAASGTSKGAGNADASRTVSLSTDPVNDVVLKTPDVKHPPPDGTCKVVSFTSHGTPESPFASPFVSPFAPSSHTTFPARPAAASPPEGGVSLRQLPAMEGDPQTAAQLGSARRAVKTRKLQVGVLKGDTYIDNYVVVQPLGSGSFGKVKLCLDTTDGALYAVKAINKKMSQHEDPALQEVRVMQAIDHTNLVCLHEVIDDEAGNKLLMVMEFMNAGLILSQEVPGTPRCLPEPVTRYYVRHILLGLAYLHDHNIVHADVKPENVLLSSSGHAKLADFGQSWIFPKDDDVLTRTLGTPAFAAPEVCTGTAYHGRGADMWALGVTLYVFTFGEIPFKGDTIMALYAKIINDPLAFPERVALSAPLRDLLQRLLEKDPAQRLTTQQALEHEWISGRGGNSEDTARAPSARVDVLDEGLNGCTSTCERNEALEWMDWLGAAASTGPANSSFVAWLSDTPGLQQQHFKPGDRLPLQNQNTGVLYLLLSGEVDVRCQIQSQTSELDTLGLVTQLSEYQCAGCDSLVEGSLAVELLRRLAAGEDVSALGTALPQSIREDLENAGANGHGHDDPSAWVMSMAQAAAERARDLLVDEWGGAVDGPMVTQRSAGSFVGELDFVEPAAADTKYWWQTEAVARTPVTALQLNQADLLKLYEQRPLAQVLLKMCLGRSRTELRQLMALRGVLDKHF